MFCRAPCTHQSHARAARPPTSQHCSLSGGELYTANQCASTIHLLRLLHVSDRLICRQSYEVNLLLLLLQWFAPEAAYVPSRLAHAAHSTPTSNSLCQTLSAMGSTQPPDSPLLKVDRLPFMGWIGDTSRNARRSTGLAVPSGAVTWLLPCLLPLLAPLLLSAVPSELVPSVLALLLAALPLVSVLPGLLPVVLPGEASGLLC